MTTLPLPGCTPEPLMSYLKALGVFRLVAEQADPDARLSWKGGLAALDSRLDREGVMKFLLEEYRPTPILAPWNGGSGFYGGGAGPLNAIAESTSERLNAYREAIAAIRTFIPAAKPKDDEKAELLVRCRSTLADDVVPWLDVCFVLGEEGASFFPLLGTGGNDGRLEFTNNFMQRLADLFATDGTQTNSSSGWLSAAIFSDSLSPLGKSAIGQFNPGGIGGPNGVQGDFEAGSRVNPWDFVLMIEGALLFAGSAARRLGAQSVGRAAFPFSVESVAVGYGAATASEETTDGSRAELWLPIWESPCTYAELRYLFAEGRAQLGRRQAKNAVEFALAINLLGVNRGVTSFTRYGFLKRNGLAFLAAPLGRIDVQLRPNARLLDDPPLVEWIGRMRRACSDKEKTPSRYQTALRQIDRAMFQFASRSEQGNDAKYLTKLLIALGIGERTLAGGLTFCQEKYLRPLQGLSSQWLDQADDGSREFRLAAALAGIGAASGSVGPFRVFLEEVEFKGRHVAWSPGSTSAVWSNRSLAANLAAVVRRRQMEAFGDGIAGIPIRSMRWAPLADIVAFLREEIDDEKLAALLWALPALDWSAVEFRLTTNVASPSVPVEFAIPRLLVEPLPLVAAGGYWQIGETNEPTTPDPDVFHVLASGRSDAIEQTVERAARRLKSGGRMVVGYRNRRTAGKPLGVASSIKPERLLAAMLFPLSQRDLEVIANIVLYPPESKE
jgi:CRISPR-associated protein Csx17